MTMPALGAASPPRGPGADGSAGAAADTLRLSTLQGLTAVMLTGSLLAPSWIAAAQTPEERVELLEAKVESLTVRVTALEARGDSTGSTEISEDGVAWQLGAGLADRPLRVSHKSVDADRGVVELLLRITAPLPEPARWQVGATAPVVVLLRTPDGAEQRLPMTLLRGAMLQPGGHLHLIAETDPAQLAGATLLRVEPVH